MLSTLTVERQEQRTATDLKQKSTNNSNGSFYRCFEQNFKPLRLYTTLEKYSEREREREEAQEKQSNKSHITNGI